MAATRSSALLPFAQAVAPLYGVDPYTLVGLAEAQSVSDPQAAVMAAAAALRRPFRYAAGGGSGNHWANLTRQIARIEFPNNEAMQAVFYRLIQQESGFADDVVLGTRRSSAGAQGIAQFMPATAAGMGINPLDPQQALHGAARYLKDSLARYGGDVAKAVASYNAGAGNVDSAVARGGSDWIRHLPGETQQYLSIIQPTGSATFPTAGNPRVGNVSAAQQVMAVAALIRLLQNGNRRTQPTPAMAMVPPGTAAARPSPSSGGSALMPDSTTTTTTTRTTGNAATQNGTVLDDLLDLYNQRREDYSVADREVKALQTRLDQGNFANEAERRALLGQLDEMRQRKDDAFADFTKLGNQLPKDVRTSGSRTSSAGGAGGDGLTAAERASIQAARERLAFEREQFDYTRSKDAATLARGDRQDAVGIYDSSAKIIETLFDNESNIAKLVVSILQSNRDEGYRAWDAGYKNADLGLRSATAFLDAQAKQQAAQVAFATEALGRAKFISDQKTKIALMQLPAGTPYIPGYEPNGSMNAALAMLGVPPIVFKANAVNYADLDPYVALEGASQQMRRQGITAGEGFDLGRVSAAATTAAHNPGYSYQDLDPSVILPDTPDMRDVLAGMLGWMPEKGASGIPYEPAGTAPSGTKTGGPDSTEPAQDPWQRYIDFANRYGGQQSSSAGNGLDGPKTAPEVSGGGVTRTTRYDYAPVSDPSQRGRNVAYITQAGGKAYVTVRNTRTNGQRQLPTTFANPTEAADFATNILGYDVTPSDAYGQARTGRQQDLTPPDNRRRTVGGFEIGVS